MKNRKQTDRAINNITKELPNYEKEGYKSKCVVCGNVQEYTEEFKCEKCGSNNRSLIKYLKETKKVKREKKVLGYSGTTWDRYGQGKGKGQVRIEVRIIGKVTKKYFIEKVADEFCQAKNWIRERICETGNEVEVSLANEQPGTIFVLDENKQILESFFNELTESQLKEQKLRLEKEDNIERERRISGGRKYKIVIKNNLVIREYEKEKKEVRTKLLNNLIEQVKQTPYPFGIEIKQYNLIREEKRWLADKGLSLHGPGRHKSMILTYPQHLRARDIREKVHRKQKETKQIRKQKDKTIQGIRRRELTVRKQILNKEIKELEEYLNQSAPDEDTKYFERVIREKKEQLSKMERGWLDYLNRLTMEVK